MITISWANLKGGVGKSNGVYALSGIYSQAPRKYRTLVADLDPQGSCSSSYWGARYTDSLPAARTLAALFDDTAPPARPEAIIHPTELECISIIPANAHLFKYNIHTPDPHAVYYLSQFLDSVADQYDICLIDTPPSMQQCTYSALTASHWVICPTSPEQPAVEGLSHILRTIDVVSTSLNPRLQLLGHLITMFDIRLTIHKAMEQVLRERYGVDVFEQRVPIAAPYKEAVINRKPVTIGSPRSAAAAAIRGLADEIDSRIVLRSMEPSGVTT